MRRTLKALAVSVSLATTGLLASGNYVPVHAQDNSAIMAVLGDQRPVSELSDSELAGRLEVVQSLLQQEGVPEAERAQMLERLGADRAELERRSAAALAAPQPEAAPVEAAPAVAAPVEAAPVEAAPVEAAPAPAAPAVEPALEAAPPPAPEPEQRAAEPVIKKKRIKVQAAPDPDPAALPAVEPLPEPMPEPVPLQPEVIAVPQQPEAAPAAPLAVAPADAPTDAPTAAPAAAEAPAAMTEATAEALAIIKDERDVSELPPAELKARLKRIRDLLRDDQMPADLRAALEKVSARSRKALMAMDAGGSQPPKPAAQPDPAQPDPVQPQIAEPAAPPAADPAAPAPVTADPAVPASPPLVAEPAPVPAAAVAAIAAPPPDLAAAPVVSVEAEKQAAAVIADTAAPAKLNTEDLKVRMEAQRELLDDATISVEKAKTLRGKLKADREALRGRVAKQQAVEYQKAAAAGGRPPIDLATPLIVAPTVSEVPAIIGDARAANTLNEVQLNRRIRAFRYASRQQQTADAQRQEYIEDLEADRAELKRRLLAERRQRTVLLQRPRKQPRFEINIDLSRDGPEPPQPYIWAAEANDDEIEEHLVARPIRRVPRQFRAARRVVLARPEAYVTRPEVRELLPSVEIDTIAFGFNEAFIREEEINNLDRIALIMERILRDYPEEVFLIEGHTDAVGADAYNLRLSRQRAEAVKRALIEYYVIPPAAIATVGLGERYLKIWTPEPEQENRRVTMRRITPVLSEYQGNDTY